MYETYAFYGWIWVLLSRNHISANITKTEKIKKKCLEPKILQVSNISDEVHSTCASYTPGAQHTWHISVLTVPRRSKQTVPATHEDGGGALSVDTLSQMVPSRLPSTLSLCMVISSLQPLWAHIESPFTNVQTEPRREVWPGPIVGEEQDLLFSVQASPTLPICCSSLPFTPLAVRL